ncbi:MAG: hypothetical protein LBI28_01355 [Treponema sp.]|jgi:hypothetical protein|nr:hypothetical protein [Treponema sp.]
MYFIFKIIYKIETRIVFSIIIFAFVSNIIWLIEVLIQGWSGLLWLKYTHIAFYIIYGLFIVWLVFIKKSSGLEGIKKIAVKILCYSLLYVTFMKIFMDTFYALFNPFKSFMIYILVFKLNLSIIFENYYAVYILIIIIQIAIIFIFNIVVAKIERQKIEKDIILFILLPIIAIPLTTVFVSYLISQLPIMPYHGLYLEPIHWLKMGNIIFGFIIYECSYIAYLNKKAKEQNGIKLSETLGE